MKSKVEEAQEAMVGQEAQEAQEAQEVNVDSFKNNMAKESICDSDLFKCLRCPYMTFSANDMKYHQLSTHMSLDDREQKEKAQRLLRCPGCPPAPDGRLTESFLKIHLFTFHKMTLKEIAKLTALLKKTQKSVWTHSPSVIKVSTVLPAPSVVSAPPAPRSLQPSQPAQLPQPPPPPPPSLPPIPLVNVISETNNTTDGIHHVAHIRTNEKEKPIMNFNSESNKNGKKLIRPFKPSTYEAFRGFKCPMRDCGVRLKFQESITYHIGCHINNTKELFCPECKQPFLTLEMLHNHLWKSHSIDIELNRCTECPYRIYSLARLTNIHQKIHFPEKNYECEVCSKRFKNHKQLRNHVVVHKKKNSHSHPKYPCEICKRELSSRTLLSVHMKNVHEKIKSFHCKHCPYSSSLRSSLILHLRSHTGEKPFQCSECPFRSADRSILRRHIRIHSEKKYYKCEYCLYSCIQASSIKSHLKLKHPGIKTNLLHTCPHCPYMSVNKSNYQQHIFTHNDKAESNLPSLESGGSENIIEKSCPITDEINHHISMTDEITDEYPEQSDDNVAKMSDDITNQQLPLDIIEDASNKIEVSFEETLSNLYSSKNIVNQDSRSILINDHPPGIFLNTSTNSGMNIKPRKAPKISVKSNLILKGPNSLQSFDPYSSFTDYRYENEPGRRQDIFQTEGLTPNNLHILESPNVTDINNVLNYPSSINPELLNQNSFIFDSSSLEGKDADLMSPYCLLNKKLESSLPHFNNDSYLHPIKTDLNNKINVNSAHYIENESEAVSKDNYKIHLDRSFKFENKMDSFDDNMNSIEPFDESYVYLTNATLPVMDEFTSPFYNLNEIDSNKYISDSVIDDLSMNTQSVTNNTIVIDETSCDMKSSCIFEINY